MGELVSAISTSKTQRSERIPTGFEITTTCVAKDGLEVNYKFTLGRLKLGKIPTVNLEKANRDLQ